MVRSKMCSAEELDDTLVDIQKKLGTICQVIAAPQTMDIGETKTSENNTTAAVCVVWRFVIVYNEGQEIL